MRAAEHQLVFVSFIVITNAKGKFANFANLANFMCIFTVFLSRKKMTQELCFGFLSQHRYVEARSYFCCEPLRELINEITTHFCISLGERIVMRIQTCLNLFSRKWTKFAKIYSSALNWWKMQICNLPSENIAIQNLLKSPVFILSFVWDMLFHDRILFLDCQHCRCSCKSRQK